MLSRPLDNSRGADSFPVIRVRKIIPNRPAKHQLIFAFGHVFHPQVIFALVKSIANKMLFSHNVFAVRSPLWIHTHCISHIAGHTRCPLLNRNRSIRAFHGEMLL